jgi:tetratricopeptide (TPR) repeat protein
VKLDRRYADGWASIAQTIGWKIEESGQPKTPAACAEGRAAADKAIQLNSELEEGYRAVGLIAQYCDEDVPSAEAAFNRAIELAPGRDDALRSDSWLMMTAGRFEQALALGQRAVSIDPLNPWNLVALGDAQWRLGHLAEAEAAYRKAVELNPATATLHALYANVLLSVNRPIDAVAEAERESDPHIRQLALPLALDAAGRKKDADREIAVLELQAPDESASEIAVFYACRHDTDRAIEWVKRYAAKRAGPIYTLPNRMVCLKNIESDPRYQALQKQMREQSAAPAIESAGSSR